MTSQDWRISVFDASGHWKGFTFANTEEEAREQVAAVRLPGDRAEVAEWWRGTWGLDYDYRLRFTITDNGEEKA